MFIKGLYVSWSDEDYLDKAIDAGIDTFFISLYDDTGKDKIKALFQKYKNSVSLIPISSYTQPGKRLPENEQFFNGTKYFLSTPCPTNPNVIFKLLEFPLELYRDGLCNGIAIDFEDYGWISYPDLVIPYFSQWEEKEWQCKCERCKNLTALQQRVENAELIKDQLGGIPLYHLPIVDSYIWPIGDCWLNEYTYEKWGAWDRILKNTNRMKDKGITTLNLSGLWLEKFTAKDYLERVEKVCKSSSTDGYWIYAQMRMSKNCYWRTHPNDPYSIESLKAIPYHSYIDDPNSVDSDANFFEKLKLINSNIDEYRSGLWFSIKRWFSSKFR
ncbi:hypothetical protein KKF82_06380 [Patescibacteria group bacterium]|nr:hypothetical protein [Patescibacteria group bacterium]